MSTHTYFALRCDRCGARFIVPAEDAATDRFRRAVVIHLLETHPEVAPSEAETLLESALAEPMPIETDEPIAETDAWRDPDKLPPIR